MGKKLKRYRHGDVVLKGVSRLPPGATEEADRTLAYGEATGHAHRFASGTYRFWTKGAARFVEVVTPATLVHEEHNPLTIAPGVYAQLAEREYDYTKERPRPVVD